MDSGRFPAPARRALPAMSGHKVGREIAVQIIGFEVDQLLDFKSASGCCGSVPLCDRTSTDR